MEMREICTLLCPSLKYLDSGSSITPNQRTHYNATGDQTTGLVSSVILCINSRRFLSRPYCLTPLTACTLGTLYSRSLTKAIA